MQTYKAIIFDLGKVIFDLSFEQTFEHWAKTSKKPIKDIRARYMFDETYENFERGDISEEQFRSETKEKLGLTMSDVQFDEGWNNLYKPVYEGIETYLKELKTKFKIVALTNTNVIHHRVWSEKYESTLSLFEEVFCSHLLKCRKPEKEAYQHVLNRINSSSNEVIFLDDNLDNIEGAKKIGIKAILVENQEKMRHDLERELNFPSAESPKGLGGKKK